MLKDSGEWLQLSPDEEAFKKGGDKRTGRDGKDQKQLFLKDCIVVTVYYQEASLYLILVGNRSVY